MAQPRGRGEPSHRTADRGDRTATRGPAADQASLLQAYNGQVPPDMEVTQGVSEAAQGTAPPAPVFYLLHKVAVISIVYEIALEIRNLTEHRA